MEISLDGKVALVTGASRGIGKAIAAGFAAAGAKVMLSSRKREGLEAAAAEMSGDVDIFPAHVGKVADAEACVDATIERFGGLDILVNNAGANPYYGATIEVDEARYDKTFEVNLRGPLFWSAQAVKKAMAAKPGVIINISSVGGLRSEFGLGVYNVTKAALDPPHPAARRRARADAGRRHRPRSGEDRLRRLPGRELRRRPGQADADEAAGRAGGHRQPGRVPGQRQGQLDHRRDVRHRRRRRRRPDSVNAVIESAFPDPDHT